MCRHLCWAACRLQAMDDPLLLAALTPLGAVLQPGAMRWGLCASDRCFKNKWMGAFFRAGQVRERNLAQSCRAWGSAALWASICSSATGGAAEVD